MTIFVKNKHTLQIEEFKFRCCIGEKGSTKNKKEGDKKTPKGTFKIENIYNKKNKKKKHEKLKRSDYKYDFIIPIKYNYKKPTIGRGSCIFIHLTKNYKPTAGCIGLREKDFLILAKLIKKNSKIKII